MLPPSSEQSLFLDYYKNCCSKRLQKVCCVFTKPHGITLQKTWISINTAVWTSDLPSNDFSCYFMAEQNRLHREGILVTHALGPYLIICAGLSRMHSAVQHFKGSVAPCSQRCHQSPNTSKCWPHLMANIASATFSPHSKQHTDTYVHTNVYKHTYMCVQMCTSVHICTPMYMYMSASVYMCTLARAHISI